MMSNRLGLISVMILLLADCQQVFGSNGNSQEKKGHRRTGAVLGAHVDSKKEEDLLTRMRMNNRESGREHNKNSESKIYPERDDNFDDDGVRIKMAACSLVVSRLSIDIPSETSSPYSNPQNIATFKRHSEFNAGVQQAWETVDLSQSKNVSSRSTNSGYISSSSDSDSEDGCSHSVKVQCSTGYKQSSGDMKMEDVIF